MKKKDRTNMDRSRVYNALRKVYDRLVKIRGEPREIALGFALGIFIGMSPTIGFQTAIAVFFASILKWNKISAAVGVWITNPLTVPFIYGITYLVGANLLGIEKADSSLSDTLDSTTVFALLSKTPEIIWALIIGGIITGLPLAVFGYYFCHSAVQKYQEDFKMKLARQKEKLAIKREERRRKKGKKIKKNKKNKK